MKRGLAWACGTVGMGREFGCALLLWACWAAPLVAQGRLADLDILQDRYPRAFFFRVTESAFNQRLYPTFASWDTQFNRLQGIIGKCLEEECQGREPRNIEFFTRFKHAHPNQVVLLHFNGNARDPRYHTAKYFPGHWIYRRAVMLTHDVPAVAGETVIHVADPTVFRVNSGRYKTSNDDIALLGMTADGHHDWHHCEQVKLLSVDLRARTIRVRRGCYGTRPLAFRAAHARAAAHEVEGPWGRNNHIMWFYNYSTRCPRDKDGKSCSDLLVEDLATWFGAGGKLAAFDGLEFDVFFNTTRGDTNGDGVEDNGIIGGINQYGIGVVQFAAQLRGRMGDDFIIQGDGALGRDGRRSQRAFGILNGIESEGWPNLNDWEIDDWSGGMNRHRFWQANARRPVFNYVNHKWNQPVPNKPGARQDPSVPFSRHRLVLAACQMMDAATCYSFAPPRDPDGKFGVWDELRCGTRHRAGWLGRPEGAAVSLATSAPDLLRGQGRGAGLAARIRGQVTAHATAAGVRVTALDAQRESLRFQIPALPTEGSDLYVVLTMSGAPRHGYPVTMARFAQLGVSGGMIDLLARAPIETGIRIRGAGREQPLDRSTGAVIQRHNANLHGQALPALFVHPPYRNGRGYVYWSQEAEIGADQALTFSIGMGAKSPMRSDGVWFSVELGVVNDGKVGPYQKIFAAHTKQNRWTAQRVSLSRWAGKRVRLKFVADCGPHDNATTDHAYWGDVRIVADGGNSARMTRFKQYMTWVNQTMFRSTFYFRDIQSPQVDLTFTIEGTEPVVIESLSVHAAADVEYRLFEHGLVLVNPSRRAITLPLAKLGPPRKYRYLPGTPTQDPKTNNGTVVGATVTLGARDGLFMERVD